MEYKYPKGEIVWVGHYDKDGNLRYITTSKPTRDYYYFYELKGVEFVRLGKDRSPRAREKTYSRL